MADAVPVAVHKAAHAFLAAATLSQAIDPQRNYADWKLELKELNVLRVDVVLVSTAWQSELTARGAKLAYTVPIDIAVRYRFGQADKDDDSGELSVTKIDELMGLTAEIHELFTEQRLTNFQAGVWQESRVLVAPLISALRERSQFTGINRITFRAEKSLT